MAHDDFSIEITEDYIGDYKPIKDSLVNIISSMRNTLNNIETACLQANAGAASSEELSGQVAMLSELVSEFNKSELLLREVAMFSWIFRAIC